MKKTRSSLIMHYAFLNLLLIISSPLLIHASEESVAWYEDDFSLPDDFLSDFDEIQNAGPTLRVTPDFIIEVIKLIDGLPLFEEDFFLHTNHLNKRSPLDYPLFDLAQKSTYKNIVHYEPFFVHMKRNNFTSKSNKLSSYIALQQDTLLEKLKNSFAALAQFNSTFYLDTDILFALFKNMSIEERSIGLMQTQTFWKKRYGFSYQIPFYYYERNYFATEKEKKAIQKELGASTPEESDRFNKKYLITDQLGVGDLRLAVLHKLVHFPYSQAIGGLFITIPLGNWIIKSINGNTHHQKSHYPSFNMQQFFDLLSDPTASNQQESFEMVSRLAFDSLNRTSAVLLDADLHNKRHFGIGTCLNYQFSLDFLPHVPHNIKYKSTLSIEYLIPAYEKRSFIKKVNLALLAERDFDDPNQAAENVAFLNQQIIERFFLIANKVRVSPGFIFKSQSTINYHTHGWHAYIGSDWWIKTGEKITLTPTFAQLYDQDKATAPFCYQYSITSGIRWQHKRPQKRIKKMDFGINGFATIASKGIGKNRGLSFSVNCYF